MLSCFGHPPLVTMLSRHYNNGWWSSVKLSSESARSNGLCIIAPVSKILYWYRVYGRNIAVRPLVAINMIDLLIMLLKLNNTIGFPNVLHVRPRVKSEWVHLLTMLTHRAQHRLYRDDITVCLENYFTNGWKADSSY